MGWVTGPAETRSELQRFTIDRHRFTKHVRNWCTVILTSREPPAKLKSGIPSGAGWLDSNNQVSARTRLRIGSVDAINGSPGFASRSSGRKDEDAGCEGWRRDAGRPGCCV